MQCSMIHSMVQLHAYNTQCSSSHHVPFPLRKPRPTCAPEADPSSCRGITWPAAFTEPPTPLSLTSYLAILFSFSLKPHHLLECFSFLVLAPVDSPHPFPLYGDACGLGFGVQHQPIGRAAIPESWGVGMRKESRGRGRKSRAFSGRGQWLRTQGPSSELWVCPPSELLSVPPTGREPGRSVLRRGHSPSAHLAGLSHTAPPECKGGWQCGRTTRTGAGGGGV